MNFIKYFYRFYLNKMLKVPPLERYKFRKKIGSGTTSVVASAFCTQSDGLWG